LGASTQLGFQWRASSSMCGASRSFDVLRANVVLPEPIVPTTEIRRCDRCRLLGICLNPLERESNVSTFHFHGEEGYNVSSIEDPLLKEVLAAFKEDASRMADDLLRTITTQALIAAFALLLAISSLLRLLFFVYFAQPGGFGFPMRQAVDTSAVVETALTVILFLLSVISIYSLLGLRRRYSRLLAMAEKLGR
jgi:hypothetical protein